MPTADEANRRYFREAYRTGVHGWPAEAPSPQTVALLQRVAAERPGGRLIDLGCGEGRHAIVAARLGFRVTAVDYDPGAVRRARCRVREAGAGRITVRTADIFRLSLAAHSFDVALDAGCLHHQRKGDWPGYRNAVLRILAPRGFLVLSVFSPRFYMFRSGGRRWQIAEGAYRRCFTRGDIRELFDRDFELLHMAEPRGEGRGFWHVLLRRRG